MGIVGGKLAGLVLSKYTAEGTACNGSAYESRSKLETLFGPDIWREFADKSVVDFGCGEGLEAIEIAKHGARQVFGIDIQQEWLDKARAHATGLPNVSFATKPDYKVDVILSLDAFEHFSDPAAILQTMSELLKPSGKVIACFGPTWFHPYGGHLFSVFPWAHLVFTEKSLIRWRSKFKTDGATRFDEVAGGLNQMTISRFESLVENSPFEIESLECVPIRKAKVCHNIATREFLTAVVRCRLRLRQAT
jgi:SAM-dependent methyltransferase